MRDLLKEFEGDVTVVKEWYSDDSGKPIESFVVIVDGQDYKSYKSMPKAMERALAISHRHKHKKKK
ncbi:MAG: hypothetical protein CSA76_05505 [Spirochaetales bacterium]|nr:MAG: hypothetical protein CSA76_05505 [Spirochaetales bacterium]